MRFRQAWVKLDRKFKLLDGGSLIPILSKMNRSRGNQLSGFLKFREIS
jgi:hypothetical protein